MKERQNEEEKRQAIQWIEWRLVTSLPLTWGRLPALFFLPFY
jgi:hypothetical protein